MDQSRNCSHTKDKSQNKKKSSFILTPQMGCQKFVKFVYHEPGKENSPFIVQFIGSDEILQSRAHGNAKTQLDHL